MWFTVIISYLVAAFIYMMIKGAGGEVQRPWLSIIQDLYKVLLWTQSFLLVLWAFGTCMNSVASERQNRTFEFWCTTSLEPAELLVGKLFGAPVLAYFFFLTTLPLTLFVGVLAHYSPAAIVVSEALILLTAVVTGLIGLLLSTKLEKPNLLTLILLLIFGWPLVATAVQPWGGDFPALRAIVPIRPIALMHGIEVGPEFYSKFGKLDPPLLFGHPVAWWLATVLLQGSVAFWLCLMILRAIKKAPRHSKLLSPWQALGFSLFVQFMFFALLNMRSPRYSGTIIRATEIAEYFQFFTFMLLAFIGSLSLTSADEQKVWFRGHRQGKRMLIDEHGPAWPTILLSAVISLLLLSIYVAGIGKSVFDPWDWKKVAAQVAIMAIFITRDVTFLQWCKLTRMRRPLLQGMLFVGLYYFAAASIIVAASFYRLWSDRLSVALTPMLTFDRFTREWPVSAAAIGMGIQIVITVVLLQAIRNRLSRVPGERTATAAA
jgi:hypothetical protein